ncbi:hypothetical protein PsAD13_05484 [Pseudovibrio sp. Ad13]|nr:hypothetical protein PsAD13_05484 [Pseudovibrio sp. Ad13]
MGAGKIFHSTAGAMEGPEEFDHQLMPVLLNWLVPSVLNVEFGFNYEYLSTKIFFHKS